MDGKQGTVHERWVQRAEAAYRRMFEGKSQEELVTLTQRENMAVAIGKELAAFLLEEQVARDPAAKPTQASSTCCPKCGGPGTPAADESQDLQERTLTTRAGEIGLVASALGMCAVPDLFFSAGRSARAGDGRL